MSDETARLGATPIGIALVLFGSASMAIVPTLAKLALVDGASLMTVITVRGLIGAAIMAAMVGLTGQGFRARRGILLICLLSGICYTAMSYGFIGAVAFIPVSLMLLIFFIHPIIVAVVHHYRGETTLSFVKILLIVVVFVGLAFALGPDLSSLNPFGIALAFLAAVSVTGMIFLNARAQKEASSTLITFYMTMVTVVVFGLVTGVTGDWTWPNSPVGWAGLLGTGLGAWFRPARLLRSLPSYRAGEDVRDQQRRASDRHCFSPWLCWVKASVPWQWLGVVVVIARPRHFRDAGARFPPVLTTPQGVSVNSDQTSDHASFYFVLLM